MIEESALIRKLLKKGERNRDPALVKEAAEQFHRSGDLQGEAESYAALGEMRFSAGAYKESSDFYRQSREIYKAIGMKKGEAQCVYSLSRCLAFTEGAFEGADEMAYLKEALAIAEEIADQELQVRCWVGLGACLRGTEPTEALVFYHKALQLLEKMDKGWLSAICHQSLGHLYARHSDDVSARKHYLASIEDFENAQINDPSNLDLRQAQCLECLGDLALREGDEDEAMERYKLALDKIEERELRVSQRIRDKIAKLGWDE